MPAARSRLWLIAAQIVHAPFAAPARGEMGERAVDQVGEGGFDDRVPAVGDVSGGGGFDAVGEERVVPPDREQFVEAGPVADSAYDQPGGDRLLGRCERGERGDLGDFGVGDPFPVSGSTTAPG